MLHAVMAYAGPLIMQRALRRRSEEPALRWIEYGLMTERHLRATVLEARETEGREKGERRADRADREIGMSAHSVGEERFIVCRPWQHS